MRFRITFDWVLPLDSRLSDEKAYARHPGIELRRAATIIKDLVERSMVKELVWFEGYRVENFELKAVRRKPSRTTFPDRRKR